MAAKTLHVERTWSGKELRHRKNGKDYYVPLSKTFDHELQKESHPEAWLFRQKDGRPYSHAWLRDIFHGALDAAGMKRIPLKNATRHSIASQAINRGESLMSVSKTLGHSSLQVTADNYAKMEVETMRSVVDGAKIVKISGRSLAMEED